ncbi:probable LRR receptor-like serine/threonine-protein kinase At3g47570 [Pyrus x bretschneideri]|uniref:probable LRR receptor-like serine/threonine-protein kinase At3g47570 n=1 Tax=Pyrus x bretschneideri TaxID=225117 RepID=UPI002030F8FC|nr:probable LRR receptor-like serine/threonine-protein kinase At3g47570 [Pyrus x bretschneideri]
MLDFGANKLIGSIPNQLNSLLNLTHFWVDENNLTGTIPNWIGNFSFMYALSLSDNNFEGSIPNAFGLLTSLGRFVIPSNKLSGTVPSSVYNISSLYYITFTQNQLQGELPQNVGTTLPNLEKFSGGVNKFTRSILVSLSNASKLRILDFAESGLTGKLPAENFGSLRSLFKLNFDDNRLGNGKTGDLNSLSFLANCTNLEVLGFSRKCFGGELPESIASLSTKLIIFTMGGNLIRGSIPIGIANLVNLTNLGMEQNYLGGSVPDVIGKLQKLQGLYLKLDQFSGTIPSTLRNLTSVTRLFMEGNKFEGSRPLSLGNCQNLMLLNLSMGELVHLSELDVSGNKLSGEISITLGSCASLDWKLDVSYSELLASTNGFSVDNLIGLGSFGSVYKGVIPSDGTIVVVKVLNLQQPGAFKSFIDECKALRSIRHRNILKIVTACSSIDNLENDFKSLVFEFKEKGSLDSWLYPRDDEQSQIKRLSLIQRQNIVIDVASALDYLHHYYETSIVH